MTPLSVAGALVFALLLPALRTASEQAPAVTCPVSEPALIPHQFECSFAFLCNRNETTPDLLLRCPDRMHYSQRSPRRCEPPEGTPCSPLITTVKLPSSSSPPVCPDSALSYVYLLQNPANCSQFFRCYQGEAQVYECPSYWYFDPVYEVCTPARKPQCPATNDEPIYLPHPTICSAFYSCNWGTAVLVPCPEGLFFNTVSKVCDFPENVDCNRCHI
ncbi:hypothetical protein Cfor_03659 [Coptotermes formosanus]|uniref:Chitin-binding type-2 domain-containing protein n=1 Tax=Coptotermes formosanus TaxID=36987 RepID=A0A6L2PV63_COPFO|nr:hypothetical protein Cfor_03659 [Coptotermes formosanus]